jgi:hypothetical protein
MSFFMLSRSATNWRDKTRLMDFQINSMGFKSGEYGGKNTRYISNSHAKHSFQITGGAYPPVCALMAFESLFASLTCSKNLAIDLPLP